MLIYLAHAGEEHSSTSEAAGHMGIGGETIIAFTLITTVAFIAGFIAYKLLSKPSKEKVKQTKDNEEKE